MGVLEINTFAPCTGPLGDLTTDEETLSSGTVTSKAAAYGRLRVYNDASVLSE